MSVLNVSCLSIKDTRSGTELVKDISFQVPENQCLGLIGESGAGKSLTCQAIMGVLPPWLEPRGEIVFHGRNLIKLPDKEMEKIRGSQIGIIVQDALSAFNPLFKIGSQMIETFRLHLPINKQDAWLLAVDTLKGLYIRDAELVMDKYPHQLSGGMLQRVVGAMAMALKPAVIIADEPTTALDCITQNEMMDQLREIKEQRQGSLIFVSHDLSLVRRLADYVVLLYRGEVVEQGEAAEVFANPRHSYTKHLVESHKTLSRKFRELMNIEREAA